MRFTDGVVLARKNIKEIQAIGEELFELNREASLLANIQKTKFMTNTCINDEVLIFFLIIMLFKLNEEKW